MAQAAPLHAPLVTTGDPGDPIPARSASRARAILFGGSDLDLGAVFGGRATLGGWLDRDGTLGLEATGFALHQRTNTFSAASDAAGNPPLYVPVIIQNPANNPGHEGSFTIADPNPALLDTGAIAIRSSIELWGAEANALVNLVRGGNWSLDGIVGGRYLDLRENLQLSGFSNRPFQASQQTFNDGFATRNQFVGGQLGTRVAMRFNRLTLDLTGKAAAGSTHQVVDVEGSSLRTGTGILPPPGVYPGGVLTQPGNIGRLTAETFTVIPQGQANVGFDLTSWLHLSAGYDFLYVSSVVRPGDQIDRNVNFTQSPTTTFPGRLSPAPQFNRSSFCPRHKPGDAGAVLTASRPNDQRYGPPRDRDRMGLALVGHAQRARRNRLTICTQWR